MSKGRFLTKKKWRNGQRQKGAGKSPYTGDCGHKAPPYSEMKYPRNDPPPNDYYKYLQDLGYAEDPNYIIKLKQIVNKK